MEKMWMRSVVTLALCLSVSACGKKKDNDGVSAPAAAKAPAAPPAPTNTDKTLPPAPENDKDPLNNPDNGKKPKGTQEGPGKNQGGKSGNSGGNPNQGGKPGGNPNQNGNPNQGNNPNPGQVGEKPEPVIVESDRYSGSAEDSLRDFLTYKQLQNTNEQQKSLNLRFANSIKKAKLETSPVTGVMKITLTVAQAGDTTADVSLVTNRSGKKMDLAANAKGFSGTLTCMDELTDRGQTCETSLADISYAGASLQVIFRHTAVSLNADFGTHNCATQECETFYNFFRYSERKISDLNTLKSAVMDSSEVILGKSAFTLTILTHDDQIMKLSAPLANPMLWPTLNTPVDRTLTAEDLVDPVTRQMRKSRMNEALNDVRLVVNDGHGHLNFLVKMKMREDGVADTFQIHVDRKVKPIVTQVEVLSSNRN